MWINNLNCYIRSNCFHLHNHEDDKTKHEVLWWDYTMIQLDFLERSQYTMNDKMSYNLELVQHFLGCMNIVFDI